ncbi:MAG: YIP1 family protein [Myxococcales bacterium]|nr:YIP1 family protein [Myxococcales bacterium]
MRAPRALAVVFDPVGAIGPAVEARAWLVPLMLAVVLTAAASAALGVKLDSARLVLPKLEAAGELAKASEREISEQVEQAQRIAIVAGVAKGLFLVPLIALLSAAGLWLMSWLLGGKATFAELFTVASLTLLPMAVGQGITLASALRQSSLSPSMVKQLVPSSLAQLASADDPGAASGGEARGGWKRTAGTALLELADFFHLWAALLLGLGFAAATKLSRLRAVPMGVVLYFLVVAAFTIGLPGLADGAGGPPR